MRKGNYKNCRGFGLLEIIIIISILAAAGIGGGFYWKEIQTKNWLERTAVESEKKTRELVKNNQDHDTVASEELYSWQTYRTDAYELKYPDKFKVYITRYNNQNETSGGPELSYLSKGISPDGIYIWKEGLGGKNFSLAKMQIAVGKIKSGETLDTIEKLDRELRESSAVKAEYRRIKLGEIYALERNIGTQLLLDVIVSDKIYGINVYELDELSQEELDTARKIISTIKFFNPSDTSLWKTYRNEKYGFEVRYPRHYYAVSEESRVNFWENIQQKDEGLPAFIQVVFVKKSLSQDLGVYVESRTGETINTQNEQSFIESFEPSHGEGLFHHYQYTIEHGTLVDIISVVENHRTDKEFQTILSTFKFIE